MAHVVLRHQSTHLYLGQYLYRHIQYNTKNLNLKITIQLHCLTTGS